MKKLIVLAGLVLIFAFGVTVFAHEEGGKENRGRMSSMMSKGGMGKKAMMPGMKMMTMMKEMQGMMAEMMAMMKECKNMEHDKAMRERMDGMINRSKGLTEEAGMIMSAHAKECKMAEGGTGEDSEMPSGHESNR